MEQSRVRERILIEHERLREQLTALERELQRVMKDPTSIYDALSSATALVSELNRHTELEDSILVPALRETDSWGPLRARDMLEHHEQQRAQFARLLELYTIGDDPTRLARATQALIDDIRIDMQFEEREVLNGSLLRDDLIAIDLETG